ncbi:MULTISPECIES: hypothetical protein [Lactococcus]|jgi:hypothetical protein|uniref:Uncharacterized protein n=1 Tax=Lactococcus formosensis TaxID=1281486 RepID=A0A9Q8Y4D3_9LACT|nr:MULTISPECIES: hypothetical protein [Lactococcus]USI66568.1 hypothetical protein LMK05_04625 [Lactococcus petauri]USI69012.1 hypothetical protein LMK04_04555 [Lactococcus petauri]USJ21199.1 hypothetical protein LMK00_04130 [Lactococcus formosensis]WJE13679.1 hypothetical protein QR692_04525 [Lactococcus petauri]
MKIKSEISAKELENLVPQLKKIIRKNSKKEITHILLWVILATPFLIWYLKFTIRHLAQTNFHSVFNILVLIIILGLFLIDFALIFELVFYPSYLRGRLNEDTTFHIDLTEEYKKSIRLVVILEDHIFIYSLYKMRTKLFILIKDDTSIFEELKRELIPRNKSNLKYKCIISKQVDKKIICDKFNVTK